MHMEPDNFGFVELVDIRTKQAFPLHRFPYRIGRSPDCDCVLTHPSVSRLHAEIVLKNGSYILHDNGSRQGTYVNGDQVDTYTLSPDDQLQLGSSMESPVLTFTSRAQGRPLNNDLLKSIQQLNAAPTDIEKLRYFLEASRELNSSEKVANILLSLLRTALPLAQMERGYVFLSDPDGTLQFTAGVDCDGRLLKETATVSRTVIGRAAKGKGQFLLTDNLGFDDAELPQSIVAHSIRSVICIPLRETRVTSGISNESQKPLFGLLYLDSRYNPDGFSQTDHELLATIAREAAMLVENLQVAAIEEKQRLYAQELQIAAGIQLGLMALHSSTFSFAKVSAHCEPCSAIGGDFVEIVPTPRAVAAALVDVSGKGVSAAILAATLQGMLYTQLQSSTPLDLVAAAANRYLCMKSVGKYATMLLLRLHADGKLEYVNCGHVQPRVCASERVIVLDASNLPVGLMPDATYESATFQMQPGWRLFAVTDGFTEAENAQGSAFGEERLEDAARCVEIQSAIQQMLDFCAAHPPTDDCTALQLVFNGEVSGPVDGTSPQS